LLLRESVFHHLTIFSSDSPAVLMSDEHTHIEYLFRSYYARLCFFATRMTGDAALAEDIVQESFLNCWKTRLNFPHEQVAKSYLYRSVRNACLNHTRHLDVVKRHSTESNPGDASSEPIIEEIVRAELMGEVHAAIESLPEGCRTVLKMAYFEKLRNEEIAGMLDVSVNTVKTQKMRAIRLLRMRLDPLTIVLFLLLHRSGTFVQ
jgi:RNA polymerase sigma-70 factor (ECF subfamily)